MAESSIRLKVEAGGAVAALNKTSTASQKVSKSVNVLGTALKALPFIGIAEAARRFFSGFAEADKATAAVRTLGVDADALKIKLLGVSNELKGLVSQTELTAAAYDVASAGFTNASEAAEILRAATLGAVGGLSDLNTVADATTSVLNSYGLSSDKAAGLVDKFIQTQNDGKIVVAQYASQIGRVAPIAAAAGVGIDELNAAISAVTATGVPVESTFAGLRQAIASVIKPTKEAEDASKLLGIEFTSAAIKSKGFGGFLEDVIDKTGGSEVALTKLFGSVEAVATILPLANDKLVKFNSSLENQKNSAGAAERATEELGGTVSAQTTSIVNNIGNVARSLDSFLGPALRNILGTVNDLISRVSTLLQLLNDVNLGTANQEILKANLSSTFGASSQAVDNLATAVSALDSNLIKSEEDAEKFEKTIRRISSALTKARGEGFADEKAADRARQLTLVLDDYHDTLKAIKATGFETADSVKPEALGGVNPELETKIKKLEALLNAEDPKGGAGSKGPDPVEEAKKLAELSKNKVQSLENQALLSSALNETEKKKFQLSIDLAELQRNAEGFAQRDVEAQIAARIALEDKRIEAEKYKTTIEETAKAEADSLARFLSDFDAAFAQRDAQLEAQAQKMDQLYSSIGNTITTGIVDSLTAAVDGTKSLAEVASDTLRSLANIMLKFGLQTFLGGLGGGDPSSIFTKLFGGKRASGGSVMSNSSYLVGEKGPELFSPGRSGSIAPNGSLGGGANVTVNVDASGSSVEGDGDQAAQLGKAIGIAVQQELIKQKRPGGLLTR